MVQIASLPRVAALRASAFFDELYARLREDIDRHRTRSTEPFILAIDGRSGSGKTTLRQALCGQLARDYPGQLALFTLDDIYPGWDGLRAGVNEWIVQAALLASGRPAPFARRDWEHSRALPEELFTPAPIIVAEGVGALTGAHSAGLWCTSPADIRRERALTRDGSTYEPHWQRWADQEEQLLKDFACMYSPLLSAADALTERTFHKLARSTTYLIRP
ncbi:MAG: hypothetical protein Q4P78_03335 [Rothia sp. (in: high G+C Gram-positive bacteria)]|uniref:hypothetical protein n=1 Tax=Rothia sp. (in: high G+C Gram-positive bacteria) TaxID=1885016 RepID=UPI0026DFFA8C|nr:hypothetical protein [Rothia sp. (in: high G+C Gram-positive bacteria)]MDO5750222.1 hypothetical protein [Rothia sp. (in: high G+C Gram-positive bacteria)]